MPYVELHCRSNFSFLEGASHPEELVARAAELGYGGLAVTDRDSLAGVVRAHTATLDHPLKLLIGTELHPRDGLPLVLWARNRTGYANLCRLITLGRRRAPKGECFLDVADLGDHTKGVLAGILPPLGNEQLDPRQLCWYRELFGESGYLLAELHRGPHDVERLDWLQQLSRTSGLPLVAAGHVLFHVPARKVLYDVLTAIRHRTTVEQAGDLLRPNLQHALRSLDEIEQLFQAIPEAIERTQEIADQCTFSLNELKYEYPEELAPSGLTPMEYLKQLTWQGASQRFESTLPNPDPAIRVSDPAALNLPKKVRDTLEHELQLIEELQYEPYFLTVWDLVRFARSRGILCQGRGSAANSVVCYCLGITSVDPLRIDVLFERFISRERNEAPDIDVDFEHERREEVLQYLYTKYGRERAGLAAVTITYRPKSAVRDVGKALGLSLDLVDRLAKNAGYHWSENFEQRCREAGLNPQSDIGRRFTYLVHELLGFPRHLSQHVGGMIITRGPLHDLVPIENAAMEDRTVIQWNKDDIDDLGILKIDCLALGMLSAIRKCFDMIQQGHQRSLTLASIPEGDEQVYDMICKADTIGVFQIESRAQMSMLPRLRPRCYYDLVIEVAIVRPGPIQGDMVHPYLRRRRGEEPETYPNEAVRAVLRKTLGVPLFQEQCMQLAMVAAGFTPGEADQLRRAMGAWRRPGIIDQFRTKLLQGMQQHGLQGDFAERVFQQIRGFGEYGFPESHAASFALLVYVSAWLKYHYPAEFAAAIINSQPMGFYAPAQLIRDARQHQVHVLPIDVNQSDWDCTTPARLNSEEPLLRLGLRLVNGLSQSTAEIISAARSTGAFRSFADFCRRTRLPQQQLALLAEADALRSLSGNRRESLWDALATEKRPRQRTLFDEVDPPAESSPALPQMSAEEEVYADYSTTTLSLRSHPLTFHRSTLDRLGVTPAVELERVPGGMAVKIAGLVLLRQRPGTAKGITFVTLEDETGTMNLILHQRVWEKNRKVLGLSQAWLVHGRLESRESIIHVVVRRVEDLTPRIQSPRLKSRDFR